jgi:hypothetical protein
MKFTVLFILNLGLLVLFIYLVRRPNLLSFPHQGRVLTWFAVAIITLMDEFTSVFAPAESTGLSAAPYLHRPDLAADSFLCTRLVEMPRLEQHHLIGRGSSFSYLVLRRCIFMAVASIMMDISSACISSVSAVQNAPPFSLPWLFRAIWSSSVCGLNTGDSGKTPSSSLSLSGRLRHA